MKLVGLDEALKIFPEGYRITKQSLYKWHHQNSYPGLFVKLGHQLMFDSDEWNRLVAAAKKLSMGIKEPAVSPEHDMPTQANGKD